MTAAERSGRALLCVLLAVSACASPEKNVGIGDVVALDADRSVTLRHDAIAGVAAGTDRFALVDARVGAGIAPGTRVRFEAVKRSEGLAVVRLDALSEGNPGIHDHTPHHGGVVGMAGMIHLEARAEEGGLVQVFLTDRWRKPLPLTGVEGSVSLATTEGNRDLALVAGRDALEARAPRFEGREVNATVRLILDGEPIDMHFVLP
jgi:hypothetical protein